MSARILIIEDDAASRELARFLLKRAGHVVLTAKDGAEGVQQAQREIPDLILSDLSLPGLNGRQVAEHLKGGGACRGIPLIAVSGADRAQDRSSALAAGFDGFLSKPITPATFVRDVEAFLKS